jgi:hypothetical protein
MYPEEDRLCRAWRLLRKNDHSHGGVDARAWVVTVGHGGYERVWERR